jgi:uncharacterized membrane-anchored protein YhcB (DUF1043 family)
MNIKTKLKVSLWAMFFIGFIAGLIIGMKI